MKKHIITGIIIAACVALCASVWPQSAENGKVPADQVKPAVILKIETKPEEPPPVIFSADTITSEPEAVTVPESKNSKHGAPTMNKELSSSEEKTPAPELVQKTKSPKPSSSPPEPHMGDTRVVNGEKQIYILGFGWIKDEGGGSGTTIGSPGDELTGNKIGQMGGGTRVDGEGDINKMVGIMGAGEVPGSKAVINGKQCIWVPGFGWIEDNGEGSVVTVAKDMYENGHKIGYMGDEEPPVREATASSSELPELTGDEIHIVFVETPEKNNNPPSYKPDTTSP